MNRKIAYSQFLALILCLMITGQAAAVVTVGVSPGDVFKYSVVYVWTSTDANATPPAYWVEANSTEYYQATVKEVTGTTITLQTVQHFLNGTDINQTELADVGSGITGSVLLYAANLANGSYLFPSSTSMPWVINATVSRAYGSGYRDTNLMQVTMTNVNATNILYDYRTTSLYFDKASGVLVDATFEDVYSDHPEQTFSRIIKITDSSLWTVAGTPSNGDGNVGGLPMELIIAVVAVVVVVVIAVVLLLRKRGKSRKK